MTPPSVTNGGRRIDGQQRLMQQLVSAAAPEALLAQILQPPHSDKARALGLTQQDVAALRNVDARRLLIYRKLIRGTLQDTFQAQLPRTAARLGSDGVRQLIATFCERRLPTSQVLRDVAFEIARFALPGWSAQAPDDDSVADARLADLARFELFEFDTYAAQRCPRGWPQANEAELSPEQTVVFDGSMRLCRLAWATNRLPDDASDRTQPEEEVVTLLGYRDDAGGYRELELTPLAGAIVGKLWRGMALGAAITTSCAQLDEALDHAIIDGVSVVLADLSERGVLLGAKPVANQAAPWPSPWAEWLSNGLLNPPTEQELDGPPVSRNNSLS